MGLRVVFGCLDAWRPPRAGAHVSGSGSDGFLEGGDAGAAEADRVRRYGGERRALAREPVRVLWLLANQRQELMNTEADAKSDACIIAASLNDGEVFVELFDRHADRIWRYVRRRVGPAVVDEVVAETFARAFAGRVRYDLDHQDAGPWLYGIATNVLRGYARDEERRRRCVRSRRRS
jgi:hypothetical protein